MHDGPAKNLVSATFQSCCDIPKFWEIFGSLALQAMKNFLYYSPDYQMNLAHHKNRCDNRDISAFWRVPWHVTAELNEMVQYCRNFF